MLVVILGNYILYFYDYYLVYLGWGSSMVMEWFFFKWFFYKNEFYDYVV